MLVQALGRERADVVVFKARGTVDQPGDGAERIRQTGHQRLARAGIVQVGLEHHGPTTQCLNVFHSLFRLDHGITAMHADVPAILRQGQGNGAAQTLARPGDQRDAWRSCGSRRGGGACVGRGCPVVDGRPCKGRRGGRSVFHGGAL